MFGPSFWPSSTQDHIFCIFSNSGSTGNTPKSPELPKLTGSPESPVTIFSILILYQSVPSFLEGHFFIICQKRLMCYETCSKDTKTEVVVKKVAEVFLTLDCRPEQLVQLLTEDQLVQKVPRLYKNSLLTHKSPAQTQPLES